MPEPYELFAIRYASCPERRRGDNLSRVETGDAHDRRMPIDFFVWAARRGDRVTLIDSGSTAAACAARGNTFTGAPTDGLAMVGIAAAEVDEIVTTHLHWDHCGNLASFPNAHLHVQRAEMAHAAGPFMAHALLRRAYDLEQVTDYLREIYAGRVTFHDGDDELASGLSVHRVGGHTPGMQVVRVSTRRGNVVVASDAVHFYENMEQQNPFPVLVDVAEYIEAHRVVRELADSCEHIVPGHDPKVLEDYPSAGPACTGTVARIDVDRKARP